jgi:hypothetical protein
LTVWEGIVNQPGEISRRRVLIGTAWATPAIVLAVGVPRAAASGEPVVVTGVLVFTFAQISNGTNGTIDFSFAYGLNWTTNYPAGELAETHWQVTVVTPGGTTVTSEVGTEFLGNSQYTDPPIGAVITGLPEGTYTPTIRIWATVTDPESGITYYAENETQTTPTSIDVSV